MNNQESIAELLVEYNQTIESITKLYNDLLPTEANLKVLNELESIINLLTDLKNELQETEVED